MEKKHSLDAAVSHSKFCVWGAGLKHQWTNHRTLSCTAKRRWRERFHEALKHVFLWEREAENSPTGSLCLTLLRGYKGLSGGPLLLLYRCGWGCSEEGLWPAEGSPSPSQALLQTLGRILPDRYRRTNANHSRSQEAGQHCVKEWGGMKGVNGIGKVNTQG